MGGETIPEVIGGKLTGNSSVYFNAKVAFINSKTLYFTMGHELVHVSQLSILVNQTWTSVNENLRQMMEFQAYNYEAFLGRSTLSFSGIDKGWGQNLWFNKLNFIAQDWLMQAKYNYKYIW